MGGPNPSMIAGVNPIPKVSGVALLQVLLLSTLISLLSLRFSQTARDQLDIADSLDDRLRAQLLAYSVFNEVVFLKLSDKVQPVFTERGDLEIPDKSSLNFYGDPIVWREGVSVTLQDLNGVLPQLYPDNLFWKKLLKSLSVADFQIDNYLAVWKDIQDPDLRDSFSGGREPSVSPSGHGYLNGYAQTDATLSWVFHDRQDLLPTLKSFSDVNALPEQNLFNFPNDLLIAILEPDISSEIIASRSQGLSYAEIGVEQMLPSDFISDQLVRENSRRMKVIVEVDRDVARWRDEKIVYIASTSKPPFQVILNQ